MNSYAQNMVSLLKLPQYGMTMTPAQRAFQLLRSQAWSGQGGYGNPQQQQNQQAQGQGQQGHMPTGNP
jgi:hypothetical protein